MVKPNEQKWKIALEQFLEKVYEKAAEKHIKWGIVGSVATYLQGCRIKPRDIDILVRKPSSVKFFADLLEDFYQEESDFDSITKEDTEHLWFSTNKKPVDESVDQWNFKWVFARVMINETEVEVAHITAPEGHPILTNGIWEAGTKIWPQIKRVPYLNYKIPVVPLEIQLGTNLGRGLDKRIDEILQVFKKEGYNRDLLNEALSSEMLEKVTNRL
jgi:hypothetical protein